MNAAVQEAVRGYTAAELIDYERYEARADELAASYRTSQPYPHLKFEEFLVPETARELARQFPIEANDHWIRYRHVNENKASTDRWEDFPPGIDALIREMNSPRFLALISRITGIEGLLADPDIEGGGMHQSWTGGFLNVHTDFTMHRQNPSWRRRCNLIYYLNEDWNPGWGGALQLWDSRMKESVQSVECLLNRAVLFNTPRALHGFPDPLTCPDDRSRKSVQWYYYTVDAKPEAHPEATTYHARPDESMAKHLAVKLDNLALRAYSSVKRRLGIRDDAVSRVMAKFAGKQH